jgi:glycerophosphoryl diester phosphodiesterase
VGTLVIAHRTCPRDAPENSLEGIGRAATLGADGVEIDVRLSSDGAPFLLHDRFLWRTAHSVRAIGSLPTHQVVRTKLRRSSECVPSLEAALGALPAGLFAALDVKDPLAGDAVLGEIRNQRLEGRARVWSKHLEVVRLTARTAPELEASLLRDTRSPDAAQRFLDDATSAGARGISAYWPALTREFVDRARDRGLRVYSWCKRPTFDAAKLELLDGVVTDWPALVRTSGPDTAP